MKELFIDLETGGLRPIDPILQMSWIIRVDGREQHKNLFIQADLAQCDPKALDVTGILEVSEYAVEPEYALKVLCQDLRQFIDPQDPNDNFYVIGYNNHAFDCKFLRTLFNRYYTRYNDYFWNPPIDVMLIAAGFCMGQRKYLGDFKLATVARSLGIIVDDDMLHDSMYDVLLTRDVFDILAKEMLA